MQDPFSTTISCSSHQSTGTAAGFYTIPLNAITLLNGQGIGGGWFPSIGVNLPIWDGLHGYASGIVGYQLTYT
jgi:hypothetical protein